MNELVAGEVLRSQRNGPIIYHDGWYFVIDKKHPALNRISLRCQNARRPEKHLRCTARASCDLNLQNVQVDPTATQHMFHERSALHGLFLKSKEELKFKLINQRRSQSLNSIYTEHVLK